MPIYTDHQPGEIIKSEDRNDENEQILSNAHNILQLYLENYYAGKETPFDAIFFDGMSDTSKMDLTAELLTANANSAQADVIVANASAYVAGQEVIIEDDNNREINTIASIDTSASTPTFDNLTNVNGNSGTFHTIGSSLTNTIAILSLFAGSSGSENITGVTYGGVAMTQAVKNGGSGTAVAIYYLVNPPTGSQEIIITDSLSHTWFGVIETYSGVSQSNPLDQQNQTTGSGTSATVAITPTNDDALLIYVRNGGQATVTQGTGQVVTRTAVGPYHSVNTRELAVGGAGVANNQTDAWSGSNGYKACAASFNSAVQNNKLTMDNNLANTYTTADNGKVSRTTVERTGAGFDSNISIKSGLSGNLFDHYYSLKQSFQNKMKQARLWITRDAPLRQLMQTSMVATNTIFEVVGNQEAQFSAGDIVDLSTPDNLTRERHLLNSVNFTGTINTIALGGVNQQAAFGLKAESSSWSATTTAGDTILIFGIANENIGGFTNVQYNGIAMTSAGTFGSGSVRIDVYYLLNPPIGTHNITYFRSNSGFNHPAGWIAQSYTNVASATKVAGGVSPQSLGTIYDKAWIWAGFTRNSASVSVTYGTNQSTLQSMLSTNSHGVEVAEESTVTPVGTTDWTGTWTDMDILVLRPTQSGNTELELTAGVANAWTTADYVERVDAIPQMSIVVSGSDENLQDMTYEGTIVDYSQSPVRMEDQYSLIPTLAGEDIVVKAGITRNDVLLSDPKVYPIGVSFVKE